MRDARGPAIATDRRMVVPPRAVERRRPTRAFLRVARRRFRAPVTAPGAPRPEPTAPEPTLQALTPLVPPANREYGYAKPPFNPTLPSAASRTAPQCPSRRPGSPYSRGNPQMASMALNDLGPMLTASEVAEMLHLHVNTVKRLGDRGELPFYRVCKRGDRRFRLEDVMAFLARNR